MDASGKYIKGTGSFEWKEIAPPVESGQLLVDNEFLLDDGSWSFTDAAIDISGGKLVFTNAPNVKNANQSAVLTSGRWYKIIYKISGFVEGVVQCLPGGVSITGALRSANGVYTEYLKADGAIFYFRTQAASTTLNIDWVIVEEVPEGYPLLDKGQQYWNNISNGHFSFIQPTSYGTWEFFVKNSGAGSNVGVCLMSEKSSFNAGAVRPYNGYCLVFDSSESIRLRKGNTDVSSSDLFVSGNDTIELDVVYKLRVTRTKDGEWTVYIKGGSYGVDSWTLVNSDNSGTNPVTDNTYTLSNYGQFSAWVGVGSWFIPGSIKKGVLQ